MSTVLPRTQRISFPHGRRLSHCCSVQHSKRLLVATPEDATREYGMKNDNDSGQKHKDQPAAVPTGKCCAETRNKRERERERERESAQVQQCTRQNDCNVSIVVDSNRADIHTTPPMRESARARMGACQSTDFFTCLFQPEHCCCRCWGLVTHTHTHTHCSLSLSLSLACPPETTQQ